MEENDLKKAYKELLKTLEETQAELRDKELEIGLLKSNLQVMRDVCSTVNIKTFGN